MINFSKIISEWKATHNFYNKTALISEVNSWIFELFGGFYSEQVSYCTYINANAVEFNVSWASKGNKLCLRHSQMWFEISGQHYSKTNQRRTNSG